MILYVSSESAGIEAQYLTMSGISELRNRGCWCNEWTDDGIKKGSLVIEMLLV